MCDLDAFDRPLFRKRFATPLALLEDPLILLKGPLIIRMIGKRIGMPQLQNVLAEIAGSPPGQRVRRYPRMSTSHFIGIIVNVSGYNISGFAEQWMYVLQLCVWIGVG